MATKIRVEVAYALPEKQVIIPLEVEEGTTMLEAVRMSRIAERFEGLEPEKLSMGIYEKAEASPEKRILKQGERVCLYRPLQVDPKESRKRRAEKAKARKEQE